MKKEFDAIIIGGGFFGLSVAYYLRKKLGLKKVLVLEKETELMMRASYNNQARVHNGYHYPRSMLTALRSRINFPRFVEEFSESIICDFDKYYAIPKNFSKVNARQYKLFCERIGADISVAPSNIKKLFNKYLIEEVFKVKEYAFNAKILREEMLKRLNTLSVEIMTSSEVMSIAHHENDTFSVHTTDEKTYTAQMVYNCTYASINKINANSGIPLIPLKHELTEMCLIKIPSEFNNISVTVMCGPFFSFMPFPDLGLHTLSHVRYTPHSEWHESEKYYRDGIKYVDNEVSKISHFPQMQCDVARYMPAMAKAEYKGSIWEIKTLLPQSEIDDSRPILFKKDYHYKNYTCLMGGKIDNIYDVFRELDLLYDKK